MRVLKDLAVIWRTLLVFVIPLATLPILFIDDSKEIACLYGVVVMALFWITEAMPMALTGLCPIVLFPLLGVVPAEQAAANFAKDASIFSFTCVAFALCVEKWNLHRRVALRVLLLMGSNPKWLLLGFMLPTWFISMWVNNTSATAMMVPVAVAVSQQIGELQSLKKRKDHDKNNRGLDSDLEKEQLDQTTAKTTFIHRDKEFKKISKALSLCICYSASIGGSGSLTGTATNLIIQGQADEIFEFYGLESNVNVLTWLICGVPCSVVCLAMAWMWLVIYFFGIKELFQCNCGDRAATEATRGIIKRLVKQLGPLTFAEKALIGHFLLLLLVWFSMKFPGGSGWHTFFKPGFLGNSTPGILVLVSLFAFPSEFPNVFRSSKKRDNDGTPVKTIPPLLDWRTVQYSFPWGSFCLLGGGFSLAATCQQSGLSLWIGNKMTFFSNVQPWIMLLIITLTLSFMTEVTSNSASVSIFGPILGELALTLGMNPLYLMIPGALAASMAFMLPVATPPNAIVYATGYLDGKDMSQAGFMLNILCVLWINVGANLWMNAFFKLDHLPTEMNRSVVSSTSPPHVAVVTYSINNTTGF